MRFLILVLFITIIAQSCRKDEEKITNPDTLVVPVVPDTPVVHVVPDTIEPLSYFPVYPGSYWTYLRNDTDTVTDYTEPTYLPSSYPVGTFSSPYTDTCYVPFFNGNSYQPVINAYIYGYDRLQLTAPFVPIYRLWPMLSETVGFGFPGRWVDPRISIYPGEQMLVWQKTINANLDSVTILKGQYSSVIIPRVSYWTFIYEVG